MKQISFVCLLAVSLSVQAELKWTTGTYDPATWSAADNVLAGNAPSYTGNYYTESGRIDPTPHPERLVDGVIQQTEASELWGVGNGQELTWEFAQPIELTSLTIFSRWRDQGRGGITVASVWVKKRGDSDFTDLKAAAVDKRGDPAQYATLADSTGSVLTTDIVALRIVFGTQLNSGCGCAEIEAVGRTLSSLTITGLPEPIGTVSPDYGLFFVTVGETYSMSAPASVSNDVAGVCASCMGWTCETKAGDKTSGTGTAVDFVCTEANKDATFSWLWSDLVYRVSSNAETGGSVSSAAQWAPAGQAVTLTATPAAGYVFAAWTGDVPDGVQAESPTITFPVDRARTLTATFSGALSVSTAAELVDAVANAPSAQPTTIAIQPGTYALTATLVLDKPITLQGAGNDFGDVILDGGGVNANGIRMTHAGAAVKNLTVANFRLTKQDYNSIGGGVWMTGGVLADCRVTGCAVGRLGSGAGVYNDGGTVRDCVIDGNTCAGNMFYGLGYYQKGAAAVGTRLVITNNAYAAASHGQRCVVGVDLENGVLSDSLIADNVQAPFTEADGTTNDSGTMGVLVAGGTLLNCRVINNRALGTLPVHSLYGAVRRAGGTITGCVITNNLDALGQPCDLVGTKGTLTDTVTTPEDDIVRPLVAYVDPDSAKPAYPYATRETAAVTLQDALSNQVDGLVVHLAAGKTHPVVGTLPIRRNVKVLGEGDRETTVVKGDAAHILVYFYPSATESLVANVTLRDGCNDYSNEQIWKDITYTLGGGAIARFDGAGTISNCVLTAGSHKARCFAGLGAYMDGGLLTHSTLRTFDVRRDGSYGIAARLRGGAMMRGCVVSNVCDYAGLHQDQYMTAAVRVDDGELRGCLVVGNALRFAKAASGKKYTSGVYVTGASGRIVNCTIADNTLNIAPDDSAGLTLTAAATVLNTVVAGNTDKNGERNRIDAGGTWTTCCTTDPGSLKGSGNVTVPSPLFDVGGYFLPAKSPLIGTATVEASWMETDTDWAGAPRLRDNVADIGASVYRAAALACAIRSEGGVTRALGSLETTLSADVDGDLAGLVYYWDADGDGVAERIGGDKATALFSSDTPGTYDVRLWVTNAAQVGATSVLTLTIVPKTVYVRKDGEGAVPPFISWETAASNLYDAVAVADAGTTVLVGPGDYALPKTLTIDKSCKVLSTEGPERTSLTASFSPNAAPAKKFRSVVLEGEGATLGGFAVNGGYVSYAEYTFSTVGGGCVLANAGTVVTNCVLTGGSGGRQGGGYGAGVLGTLVDSVVRNGEVVGGQVGETQIGNASAIAEGVGVCVAANGHVERCVVSNFTVRGVHGNYLSAGGILAKGGTVRSCVVTDCTMTDGWEGSGTLSGSGLVNNGALVENCTVTRCSNQSKSAAAIVSGGTLRNSIVNGNVSTIGQPDIRGTGGAVTYTCTSQEIAGEGNVTVADPLFRRPERGDFRLKFASPCVDAGQAQPWMADAKDVLGNPRVRGRGPDLGATEQASSGLTVIVR